VCADRLRLPDGRELAWFDFGSPEGRPVVALHGGLVSGYYFAAQSDTAQDHGVRLIAVDRPGYGDSTLNPEQTYQSVSDDIGRLVDHLGFDRFGVLGQSSGGPFAAACARFLSDRVTACAIVSGGAPPEGAVSNAQQQHEFRVARRLSLVAPGLLALAFQTALRLGQRAPDKVLARMERNLPPCDVAVIERPVIRAGVREEICRPKASTAGRAATLDRLLQARSWGFRIEEIGVPVHVWHGDLDRIVVVEEGVYLARRIPSATLHRLPDAGHWLLHSHFAEITSDVVGEPRLPL
jgi:pimeloyl-ACP methyl ester carboxylesterase